MGSLRVALFAALAFVASAPAGATVVDVRQLSANEVQDSAPQVSGERVAWERGTGARTEIMVFDGSSSGAITSNQVRDFAPQISGSRVLWKRTSNNAKCQLQLRTGSSTDPVGDGFDCVDDARLAGPFVIWIDNAPLLPKDVFLRDDEDDDVDALGERDEIEREPRVGDDGGSPTALWKDARGLWYFAGGDTDQLSSNTVSEHQIWQDRAVWVEVVGGDEEIFYFDGSTVQQLTDNGVDDDQPQLHGDYVVWRGRSGTDTDIFVYDGESVAPLTEDDLDDRSPQVSEGEAGVTIAWTKDDGNDDELWVFDGCASSQITDNPEDDVSPSLDGNLVAWVQDTGDQAEIFSADFECEPFCGDGNVDPGEACDDGNTAAGDGCDALCALECGNGTPEGAEECDDGNREPGDGCSELCLEEVCGNERVDFGEECDDGNTLLGDGCDAGCQGEEPASKVVRGCIQKMNESGVALAKAQHKLARTCLDDAAAGRVDELGVPATAQDCLANDPKGKVAAKEASTLSVEAKKCDPAELPTFGYAGGAAVNAAGVAEPVALVADVFGPDLDAAGVSKAADKVGAVCQKEVLEASTALSDKLYKLAFDEKGRLLKGKPDGSLAVSNEALESGLFTYLAADANGKAAAKADKIRKAAAKHCAAVALDTAFPGCAPSASTDELATCAIGAARCRFCRAFNAFDGIAMDCDVLDDGTENTSCP